MSHQISKCSLLVLINALIILSSYSSSQISANHRVDQHQGNYLLTNTGTQPQPQRLQIQLKPSSNTKYHRLKQDLLLLAPNANDQLAHSTENVPKEEQVKGEHGRVRSSRSNDFMGNKLSAPGSDDIIAENERTKKEKDEHVRQQEGVVASSSYRTATSTNNGFLLLVSDRQIAALSLDPFKNVPRTIVDPFTFYASLSLFASKEKEAASHHSDHTADGLSGDDDDGEYVQKTNTRLPSLEVIVMGEEKEQQLPSAPRFRFVGAPTGTHSSSGNSDHANSNNNQFNQRTTNGTPTLNKLMKDELKSVIWNKDDVDRDDDVEGEAEGEDGERTTTSKATKKGSKIRRKIILNKSTYKLYDVDIHVQKNYMFVTDTTGCILRFELFHVDDAPLANNNTNSNHNVQQQQDHHYKNLNGDNEFGQNGHHLNTSVEGSSRNGTSNSTMVTEERETGASQSRSSNTATYYDDESSKWVANSDASVAHHHNDAASGNDDNNNNNNNNINDNDNDVDVAGAGAGAFTGGGVSNIRGSQLIIGHPTIITNDNNGRSSFKVILIWDGQRASNLQLESTNLSHSLDDTKAIGAAAHNDAPKDNSHIRIDSNNNQKQQDQIDQLVGNTKTSNYNDIDSSNHITSNNEPIYETKISVDWINNRVYVLQQFKLFSLSLNGKDRIDIVDDFTPSSRPKLMRCDPHNGYIFWLTKGNFTNTIYRFNLNSIQSQNSKLPLSVREAEPIIFDLPTQIELFVIDYKQARIYVPFPSNVTYHLQNSNISANFLNGINQTESFGTNSCDSSYPTNAKLMAYNLDGTDRGPVRHRGNVHTGSVLNLFDHLLDMTIDEKLQFYWLSKTDGITEESKESNEDCYRHVTNKFDEQFKKVILFSQSRQPMIKTKSTGIKSYNQYQSSTRSIPDNQQEFYSRLDSNIDQSTSNGISLSEQLINNQFNQSQERLHGSDRRLIVIPLVLVIIGILIVIGLLIKQRNPGPATSNEIHDGADADRYNSISGATDSCNNHSHGIGDDVMARYYRPPTTNTGTSYDGDNLAHIGIESTLSTNYERDPSMQNHHLSNHHMGLISNDIGLVTSNRWPDHCHESNRLYVPAEVLQDDVLAAIPRITIDQLKIEKDACLGSGFFGTVYIGSVINQRDHQSNGFTNKQIQSNHGVQQQHRQQNHDQSASTIIQITESDNGSCCEQIMTPSASSLVSSFATTPTSSSACSTSSSSVKTTSGLNSHVCPSNTNCAQSTLTSDGYLTPIHYNCNCQFITEDNKKIVISCDGRHDSNRTYKNTTASSSCYCDFSSSTVNKNGQQLVQTLTLGYNDRQYKVAIKKLKDDAKDDDRRDFLQEAKLLASCNHPHIVKLLGICLDRGSTLIIMELMAGGDLQKYLQERRPRNNQEEIAHHHHLSNENLNEDDLISMCLDIVDGLCYLERLRFVHRDLAARNCLLSSTIKEERVIKISDFGLARDIYHSDYYINRSRRPLPARWLAPECLSENRYSTKSDVWSFAVLMWEIMTFCQRPYINIINDSDDCQKLKDFLNSGKRLPRPDRANCGDEVFALMTRCWAIRPEDRPSFQECRDHLSEVRNRMRNSLMV